jgi:tyrosine-protein kinase Etk/Wzc
MSKKVAAMQVIPGEKHHHRPTHEFYDRGPNPAAASPQDLQLNDLISTIVESWRLIVGITLSLLLLAIAYIILATPVYRSDVLLQIEKKPENIDTLINLNKPYKKELPLSAEYEIIRSRMVIGAAVDRLHLDIIARPIYLPIIGAFLAQGYNEHIKVDRFDVPDEYLGKKFTIVASKPGTYKLYGEDGVLVTQGEVDKPAAIVRINNQPVQLFVSELNARQGAKFELMKMNRLETIQQLQNKLEITEPGKELTAIGNHSGVLQLSLEGTDREKITKTLNEIASTYLRHSVNSKSADAQKTLTFLERQLPTLKQKVDSAEGALNNYRLQKGSVDLPLETQTTLERVVKLDSEISKLKQDRQELLRRFTPQHPRIEAIDAQIQSLNSELEKVDSKVKSLPVTQQDILRLTRDADVSRSLYTTLLNSAQELKVVKAGATGDVHIIDYAEQPIIPVKPKKELIIALTLILGTILGISVALIRKSLFGAVQDPDLIEDRIGLPIYATIPYSRKQHELATASTQSGGQLSVLAIADPQDLAIESLRSLRTSLYYNKHVDRNNVISITSPSPGAGKSFVCANLGVVLAVAGKRVLVIDADMRKGRIHEYFGIKYDTGLSDIISHTQASDTEFNKVILNTAVKNLDFIPVGSIPLNPSELLLHKKFELVLDIVANDYEHIIIDSPPILAATDAAIVGNLAGSTLLVVKDGQNTIQEIDQSVKQLKQAGVNLFGAIYNGIKLVNSRYGYGRYYYAYSYLNNKSGN